MEESKGQIPHVLLEPSPELVRRFYKGRQRIVLVFYLLVSVMMLLTEAIYEYTHHVSRNLVFAASWHGIITLLMAFVFFQVKHIDSSNSRKKARYWIPYSLASLGGLGLFFWMGYNDDTSKPFVVYYYCYMALFVTSSALFFSWATPPSRNRE